MLGRSVINARRLLPVFWKMYQTLHWQIKMAYAKVRGSWKYALLQTGVGRDKRLVAGALELPTSFGYNT